MLYRGKEEIHSENKPNYLSTEVVQSDKYYKSRTAGVTPEVGLTTDRDLSVPMCLRNNFFYTSKIPEVMWYEPLYNTNQIKIKKLFKKTKYLMVAS